MITVTDLDAREKALNPAQSFIVQAPAGSGKTDILMKRYLILLNLVNEPEEILCVTFTKKSAAEMRARILAALADQNNPVACQVLHRDQLLQWNILNSPHRLRIQTIDSFNAFITKQLPILSQFGLTPKIMDNPRELYKNAIQELLSHLEIESPWGDSLAQVLLHMENDVQKLETLLIQMLLKRDQWLPYVTLQTDDPKIRKALESHLASITTDLLKKLTEVFPKHLVEECIFLADHAAQNLLHDGILSPITDCAGSHTLPGMKTTDKPIWLGLSYLLLTEDFSWRKRYDKNLGFKAPSASKNAHEKKLLTEIKERITALTAQLSNSTELQTTLMALRESPNVTYSESQWQILNALLQVLRVLVAELKIVFQRYGHIDYIENAQAALLALGETDAPTDLTLALDYKIKHILIDEFQDTSTSQFRLIEKITAGWLPDDGRTLFVVGDPMQSIYRFREAEVGLFIRARQIGIGNISLIPITLKTNFRSTHTVVEWINTHFSSVFPKIDDIIMGSISYTKSEAYHPADPSSKVELHPALNTSQKSDAERIIQLILELKSVNPVSTIAILVRSRTHLINIIPALKEARIPFNAVDIDPLHSRPIIQDLIALSRALTHSADRIAWLAFLRGPCVGLSLADLSIIAGNKAFSLIWDRINHTDVQTQLSASGRQCLNRILPILKIKMAERHRHSLRHWIESTWLLLGGPATTEEITDSFDVNTFFNLLDSLDKGGNLKSLDDLQISMEKLYAAPHARENAIQIMTIHNAKGLEFDIVILPHLEKPSASDDKAILLWMEEARQNLTHSLIFAPIEFESLDNSIYHYIKKQQMLKTQFENARLLYVAATRAKHQLHVFFTLNNSEDIKPVKHSMLEKLWPAIKHSIKPTLSILPVTDALDEKIKIRTLHRLILDWDNPITESYLPHSNQYHTKKGFQLVSLFSKQAGIATHTVFQQMGRHGVSWWKNKTHATQILYLTNIFFQIRMLANDISRGIDNVCHAIENTLNDTRGQWIFKAHLFAESELRLTAFIENSVRSLAIDRTFVDEENIRWIIDFKTTKAHAEKEKYMKQLTDYAQALRFEDNRKIKLGLYFPFDTRWEEWDCPDNV